MWSTEDIPLNNGFETLPAGFYKVKVNDIDLKDTSSGNGQVFHISFAVIEPQSFDGSELKEYITFKHQNATAMRIGQQNFADFVFAVLGKHASFDSLSHLQSLVLGGELIVETKIETTVNNGKTYDNARVQGFWSLKGLNRNDKKNLSDIKLGVTQAAKEIKATPKKLANDLPF